MDACVPGAGERDKARCYGVSDGPLVRFVSERVGDMPACPCFSTRHWHRWWRDRNKYHRRSSAILRRSSAISLSISSSGMHAQQSQSSGCHPALDCCFNWSYKSNGIIIVILVDKAIQPELEHCSQRCGRVWPAAVWHDIAAIGVFHVTPPEQSWPLSYDVQTDVRFEHGQQPYGYNVSSSS